MKFFNFSTTLKVAALTGGILLYSPAAHATDFVWVGTHSGAPSNWFAAKNWKAVNVYGHSSRSYGGARISLISDASPAPTSSVPGPGDTATITDGATVVVNAPITLAGLTVQDDGTLQGNGNVTVTSTLNLQDAQLQGAGAIKLTDDATATISSQSTDGTDGNTLNKVIDSSGTVNWSSGEVAIQKDFHNRGHFNASADASFEVAGTSNPTFYNEGTFVQSGTSDQTSIAASFQNTGDISVRSGDLDLGPNFVQTDGSLSLDGGDVSASGTLQILGGTVGGTGAIDTDVVNDGGTFRPGHSPGEITIMGNYTQTTDGTLNMEVGGTDPGISYDQMDIWGTANLDGTLTIQKYGGYTPVAGNSYELLKYYDVDNNFAIFNGMYPGGTLYYKVTKTPSFYVAKALDDTAVPSLAITSPANGGNYKGVATVQGTASDTNSGLASVTVRLYRYSVGSTPAGYWAGGTSWTTSYGTSNERPVTGTTTWSLTLPSLPTGQYYVKATAKDNVGNTTSTSNVVFNVSPSGTSYIMLPKALGSKAPILAALATMSKLHHPT